MELSLVVMDMLLHLEMVISWNSKDCPVTISMWNELKTWTHNPLLSQIRDPIFFQTSILSSQGWKKDNVHHRRRWNDMTVPWLHLNFVLKWDIINTFSKSSTLKFICEMSQPDGAWYQTTVFVPNLTSFSNGRCEINHILTWRRDERSQTRKGISK